MVKKTKMRHVGDDAQDEHDGCSDGLEPAAIRNSLTGYLLADVCALCRRVTPPLRQPQRLARPGIWATRASPTASRDVGVGGLGGGQIVLKNADGKAAKDIDQQRSRYQPQHRHAQTWRHRPSIRKTQLHRRSLRGGACFFLVNQTGIHVGIHGHLFAWHGIQGKAS